LCVTTRKLSEQCIRWSS